MTVVETEDAVWPVGSSTKKLSSEILRFVLGSDGRPPVKLVFLIQIFCDGLHHSEADIETRDVIEIAASP